MKRLGISKHVVVWLAALVLAAPVSAFLGIGDIVFDPSNYAQAIERLTQLQRQYEQLVETYRMVRNQYEQMLWMAKRVPVDMAARYRALATPWRSSSAGNAHGNTAGWVTGINTGQSVEAGYAAAIQALYAYGAALARVPAEHLPRLKTSYATVELTDGANLAGIEVLGSLRTHAPFVERAISGLEADSLSPDSAMNTEIAVLNKINAASLIAVRSAQDTNKLLVALAEQQIIEAKRTRDAEAQAINNHIRFVTDGKAVMTAQAAGASDAMLAWRMP